MKKKIKIGIIGLGYVGLPLFVEFSKKYDVKGFDLSKEKIKQLLYKRDYTNQFSKKELNKISPNNISHNSNILKECNFFIITVPTPINSKKLPDLSAVILATEILSNYIKDKDYVVYESTVYPGVTEDICIKIIEKKTGLKPFNNMNKNLKKGFYYGYSPERINPGDKKFTISNIVKITSGSNTYACKIIDNIYKEIITAGTYKVESIKVAEAAKVIENTQRDLNIALVNELSIIFNKMNIDTKEVLDAASTKWNFMPFQPGLVGGHCIGVDPYYLTTKAIEIGYHPEVILAGRKINDGMAIYVADQLIKSFLENNIKINNARVLIMGLTFKENCSDIRNSKVYDLVNYFLKEKIKVNIYDPLVNIDHLSKIHKKIYLKSLKNKKKYFDVLILAVPHRTFIKNFSKIFNSIIKKRHYIFDIKSALPKNRYFQDTL